MTTTIPLLRVSVPEMDAMAQLHAVRSRAGMALMFSAHFQNGANYNGLRLDQFYHKIPTNVLPLSLLQPWSCMSNQIECYVYELFRMQRGYIHYVGLWGQYICTFDFVEGDYPDNPEEFKTLSLFKLDNGQFGAYPNNYFRMQDKTWTGKLDLIQIPKIKRVSEFVNPEWKI
jgi:hypothetical protein